MTYNILVKCNDIFRLKIATKNWHFTHKSPVVHQRRIPTLQCTLWPWGATTFSVICNLIKHVICFITRYNVFGPRTLLAINSKKNLRRTKRFLSIPSWLLFLFVLRYGVMISFLGVFNFLTSGSG